MAEELIRFEKPYLFEDGGEVEVVLKGANGYLCVTKRAKTNAKSNGEEVDEWAKWKIIKDDGGVRLQHAETNKFVRMSKAGAVSVNGTKGLKATLYNLHVVSPPNIIRLECSEKEGLFMACIKDDEVKGLKDESDAMNWAVFAEGGMPVEPAPLDTWSAVDVGQWLEMHEDLAEHASVFVQNGVIGAILRDLTADDLKDAGIDKLGDRKALIRAIEAAADGSDEHVGKILRPAPFGIGVSPPDDFGAEEAKEEKSEDAEGVWEKPYLFGDEKVVGVKGVNGYLHVTQKKKTDAKSDGKEVDKWATWKVVKQRDEGQVKLQHKNTLKFLRLTKKGEVNVTATSSTKEGLFNLHVVQKPHVVRLESALYEGQFVACVDDGEMAAVGEDAEGLDLQLLVEGLMPMEPAPIKEWTPLQVAQWVELHGYAKHADKFVENDLKGVDLVDMSGGDLKDIGIGKLGDRKALQRVIQLAKDGDDPVVAKVLRPAPWGVGATPEE